jgi:hypothetical protein
MMKTYIEKLKIEVINRMQTNKDLVLGISNDPWQPLETQILNWWRDLPECMKSRSFKIVEIAGICKGRYQPKPALRSVAAALRSIGWHEMRCWKSRGRNQRFWVHKDHHID